MRLERIAAVFAAGIASVLLLQAAAPKGWILAGSKPKEYDTGVDSDSHAYLKATKPVDGFGTLMQSFEAGGYLGKRIRFTGLVKAQNVQDWAGLWMRVDKGTQPVAFDNMQDRPIKGTSDWQSYDVVLDVPQEATGIAFGVLLSSSGTVWLDGLKFEIVSKDVPVTKGLPGLVSGPTNLNFAEK